MWPPTLDDLKRDKDISDTRDDAALQPNLDAAIAFVERVRPEFNYSGDELSELPEPTADMFLGTIRLALRWFARRKSPEALIELGELGSARIPSFDPDIERMLGIGRYKGPVLA